MVEANRIKLLDGDGAALGEIASPPYLRVVSNLDTKWDPRGWDWKLVT